MRLDRKLFIFLFLLALFAVSFLVGGESQSIPAREIPGEAVGESCLDVYYFYSEGCPHCQNVKPFLSEMERTYPIEIHRYDLFNNRSCLPLFDDYSSRYGLSPERRGVPTLFVSDTCLVGDTPILEDMEAVVQEALADNSQVDPAQTVEAVASLNQEPASTVNGLSLITVTVAGLVDSISPCSIGILVFLIGARVLVVDKRKRILRVGLVFCLSVFIAYFLFGLGLLSFLQVSGFSNVFGLDVGLIAILIGTFYLRDAFWSGRSDSVMEIPRSLKPLLMKMLKGVTNPVGAFVMGFVAVSFELPCTGGPYLLILGQLADSTTRLQAIPLLLYYNALFVLPLILVSLLLYSNLFSVSKIRGWSEKNKGFLRFVGGIVMIALGVLTVPTLLFKQMAQVFFLFVRVVGPYLLAFMLLYHALLLARRRDFRPRLKGTLLLSVLFTMVLFVPNPVNLRTSEVGGDSRQEILPASATPIDSCGILNVSGSYVLTADVLDHAGNCFNISAHSVTLDCNGHTISGDGEGIDIGVLVSSNNEGATVKNCTIEVFYAGIYADGNNNDIKIENNTISNNELGIYVGTGPGGNIIHNIIVDNSFRGMQLEETHDCWIYDNFFNNSYNIQEISVGLNLWDYGSIDCASGPNIADGPCIGGNYWTNPTGNGFSDTCTDYYGDGICDHYYPIPPEGYNQDNYPLTESLTVCGNSIVEFGEECDPPSPMDITCGLYYNAEAGGFIHGQCTADCQCAPPAEYCGNSQVDPIEQCDPPVTNSPQCPQTNECIGPRWCTYPDSFGDCTDVCGCVKDTPSCACVVELCGAECATDGDCPPGTECINCRCGKNGPRISNLDLKIIESSDQQLIAMQTEQADVWTDIPGGAYIETLDSAGFKIVSSPAYKTCQVVFNMRTDQSYRDDPVHGAEVAPILSDVDFRHAIAHAIDKQGIVSSIYSYIATPLDTFVPPALERYYNPDITIHTYEPGDPFTSSPGEDSAVGILKDAGYVFIDADITGTVTAPDYWQDPFGDELPPMKILAAVPAFWSREGYVAMEVVDDLGDIGLAGTVENGYSGIYSEGNSYDYLFEKIVVEHDFDMALTCWPGLGRDPIDRDPDFLYYFFHSSQDTPGSYNLPGISDPEVDTKVEDLHLSLNELQRETASKQAQEKLSELLPYIPMYSWTHYDAYAPTAPDYVEQPLENIVNMNGYGSDNPLTKMTIKWTDEILCFLVRWIIKIPPTTLNPLFVTHTDEWAVLDTLNDPLIANDPNGEDDIAWAATNWEITETAYGMDVTFHLREDIYWHDGIPVTADDVEFNWEFIRDWQIPMYKPMWENLIDVQVLGTYEIKAELSEASLGTVYDLSDTALLLPPQIWDRSWANQQEILDYQPTDYVYGSDMAPGYSPGPLPPPTNLFGTGPFIFQSHDEIGGIVDLDANRNYFIPYSDIEARITEMCHNEYGDYNQDGVINVIDLTFVAFAYGSLEGEPNYDRDADLNSDGIVDMRDLYIVARNLGKSCME